MDAVYLLKKNNIQDITILTCPLYLFTTVHFVFNKKNKRKIKTYIFCSTLHSTTTIYRQTPSGRLLKHSKLVTE